MLFTGAGEASDAVEGVTDAEDVTKVASDVNDVEKVTGTASDAIIEGGNKISNGIKSWDEINSMLEKEGVNQAKVDEILHTPKGSRPDSSTYLSDDYINEHLSNFQDGVTKIKSKVPVDIEGVGLGTFVMPKSVADDVINQAGGDISKLEKLLGLNPGDLGTNPVRVDIANPQNIRIPNGNEAGAWPGYWTPGGYTKPGGVIEAVIDPVTKNDYVVIDHILEK